MTFPTISSNPKVSGTNSGTTHTVNYHTVGESAYVNGDLLILIAVCDGSNDYITLSGDWATNALHTLGASHGNNFGWAVSYKSALASDNGNNFSITTSSSEEVTAFIIHVKDWDSGTAPESSLTYRSTNDDWQSESLAPANWDSSADDTTWIAYTGGDPTATIATYPSNCTSDQFQSRFSASTGTIAICSAQSLVEPFSNNAELTAWSTNEYHFTGLLGIKGATSDITIAVPNGPLW